jgi:hypothetical protein
MEAKSFQSQLSPMLMQESGASTKKQSFETTTLVEKDQVKVPSSS